MKARHVETLLRDTEDVFAGSLFEDIMVGTMAPAIPERLEPYTRDIRRDEVRREGWFLFLVWLVGEEDGVVIQIPEDRGAPCYTADDQDLWFPEWPDAKNTTPEEFRDQDLEADLDAAEAKRLCAGCNIRQLCLARAQGVVHMQEVAAPEPDGIFGGWGSGARSVIFSESVRKRRAYLRGVREQEDPGLPHLKHAMSAAELTRSLAAARGMAKRISIDFPLSVFGLVQSR
jgi:hypothetical protein